MSYPPQGVGSGVSVGLLYKGALDASAGTYPTGVVQGNYYVISVAGTISGTIYDQHDWAVYNGISWDKLNAVDAVTSVDGKTAAVDLSSSYAPLSHSHAAYILHSLATDISQFLVSSGTGAFVMKTLAEIKTLLGLGSAAYTASTDYATSGHNHDLAYLGINAKAADTDKLDGIDSTGFLAAGAQATDSDKLDGSHASAFILHSLATDISQFLVSSGTGVFVMKTLAEVKTLLGLGSAAYTASTDYAGASHSHTDLTGTTSDTFTIDTDLETVANRVILKRSAAKTVQIRNGSSTEQGYIEAAKVVLNDYEATHPWGEVWLGNNTYMDIGTTDGTGAYIDAGHKISTSHYSTFLLTLSNAVSRYMMKFQGTSLTSYITAVIDNTSARLGIGVETPVSPLDVRAASGEVARFSLVAATSDLIHILIGKTNSITEGFKLIYDGSSGNGIIETVYAAGKIFFKTNGIYRMSVAADGKVGIGIDPPAYLLDVLGDVNFTGTIRKSGTALAAADVGAQPAFSWTDITTAAVLAADNGYSANSTSRIEFLLPATCSYGKIIEIAGINTGGWRIVQNPGQKIINDSSESGSGVNGSVVGSAKATVRLLCTTANTTFQALSTLGTLTLNSGAARGIFAGQSQYPGSNIIEYFTMETAGNSTDFGDLTYARGNGGCCASATRGLFGGGIGNDVVNTIDYVTIASAGNAADFGDLTSARQLMTGCSSSTRGVFACGWGDNTMDYVTIASTGNATDFGDLTESKHNVRASGSATRGMFNGGITAATARLNTIEYITYATTGNGTDFGDLTITREGAASCSTPIKNLTMLGATGSGTTSTTIDKYNIATAGNASSWGDIGAIYYSSHAACSNPVFGLFGGGPDAHIRKISFATDGSFSSFGDLTGSRTNAFSCSNAHGGL